MKLTIPPTPNPTSNTQRPPGNAFLIPEGDYRAVLKQMKPHHDGGGKIRLVFTVTVPGCPFPYLAGKNYLNDLSESSALRGDLYAWRGHDLTPGENQARSIETNDLVGRPADIRINHIENEGHENPFVYVKAIYPPGTLVSITANNDLDKSNTGGRNN